MLLVSPKIFRMGLGALTASVTVLTDGTRSPLAQAFLDWQGIGAQNPQIYALGVKELWETKKPIDAASVSSPSW